MTTPRNLLAAISLAAALAAPHAASANERYVTPPPVILSPDLTGPWVMQLQGAQGAGVGATAPQPIIRRHTGQRQVYQPAPAQPVAVTPQRRPAADIDPIYLPQTVTYNGNEKPGSIVIDTQHRFLYLVNDDGTAKRYGVGVGREGFAWKGTERITRKAEWPSWRPPAEMIKREAKKGRHLPTYMPGGPKNPLGARALYLGSTLYRIHGTNQPWSIGQAVSSGCIRMRNQDVKDLYTRVQVGATVVVR